MISIAVMDYALGKILMYKVPVDIIHTYGDVECWLLKNTDYKESTCYYMTSTGEIPVEYL